MPTLPRAIVTKRYAASYTIFIGTSTKIVNDNGLGEIISATLGDIAPGTYDLTITPTSDSGKIGTPTIQSITVGGAPLPPGVPTYFSGTITNTVIRYAASATSGATYRIYMPQEVGGPTFIESPAATHAAGTGTLSTTLPAIPAAAGDITVFVSSVNGGIESAFQRVTITYLADGTVPIPAPNIPSLSFPNVPIANGYVIMVLYKYDATNQDAAPSKIQTRIQEYETGTTTEQSEVTIAAFNGSVSTGSLTISSAVSDQVGWSLVSARTKSAGGTYSPWSEWIGPIWVSSSTALQVSDVTVNIVG